MEIELESKHRKAAKQPQPLQHTHLKYNHKRVKAKRVHIDEGEDESENKSDSEMDLLSKIGSIKKSEKSSPIGKYSYKGPKGRVKPVDFWITIATIGMITLPTLAFLVVM